MKWKVSVVALLVCAFAVFSLLQRRLLRHSNPISRTNQLPTVHDVSTKKKHITSSPTSDHRFSLVTNIAAFSGAQSTSSPSQAWSRSLSDAESSRCRQVAWNVVKSQTMWERFRPKRITTTPIKLNTNGIQCYLDEEPFDRVIVAIPSGGRIGWHPCFIGVTVARGTYEVFDMYESHWF